MPRDELITRLNESFQELVAAVEDLSDEQMTRIWFGDWGAREILARSAPRARLWTHGGACREKLEQRAHRDRAQRPA